MTTELEDRSIARLIPAFKSAQTQEGYLIKLRMFLEFCGLGPDEVVSTALFSFIVGEPGRSAAVSLGGSRETEPVLAAFLARILPGPPITSN
jgi:hypothetical protein